MIGDRFFVRVATAGSAFLLLCSACVQPTNPLDPDTPLQNQARATLRGTAQAVFALQENETLVGPAGEGETLIEAAFCDAREGDHSGFDIVLREQGSTDGNPLVGRTQRSNSSGDFVFEGIPPGSYVLQLVRPGFELPPPQPLVLQPADDVVLDPLCGINRTAPERPALAALPSVVDRNNVEAGAPVGTPAPVIDLLNCTPGVHYRIDQRPESAPALDPPLTVVVEPETSDDCRVDLALFDVDGAASRTTWRISATAFDGLGNESDTATAFITRDTLAPLAPTDLAPQVGRDRVFLTWNQTPVANDDRATSWLVSYGLTQRPLDAQADCPYGAPAGDAGDAFDTASFAVQGSSPVSVSEVGATLSGILEGTTLFLQVASKDAAGNLSCWSAPVAVRPDVVAPAQTGSDDQSSAGVVASFFGAAAQAHARGSSGAMAALNGQPSVTLEGLPALDVDGVGRDLYFAAGALGIHHVTLRPDGTATSADIGSIGTIQALAAEPGHVVAGTPAGFLSVPLNAPENAQAFDPTCLETEVTDVVLGNDVIYAIRNENGLATLQATHREEVACAADAVTLEQVPDAMLLLREQLWIVSGSTLTAYDVSACEIPAGFDPETCCADTPSNGCLVEAFSTAFTSQARGHSLTPWDDLVLVGASGGSLPASAVLVLAPQLAGPPLTSGIAFTNDDSAVYAVEPRDGGFCAHTQSARTCFSTISGPLAEEATRMTAEGGGSIEFALPATDGTLLFASRDEGVLRQIDLVDSRGQTRASQSLPADDAPPSAPPEILRQLFPANAMSRRGDVVTIDSFGQLYAFQPNRGVGSLTRVDAGLASQLISLWPDATHPDDDSLVSLSNALIDVDGENLVVFASNGFRSESGCAPAAVLKIALGTSVDGTRSVRSVETLDLGAYGRPTAITIDSGRAYLASEPYRVDGIDLDTMTLDAASSFGGDFACSDAVTGATAFGVSPLVTFEQRRLLSAGTTLVDGTPRNILEVDAGEFVFGGISEIAAVGTLGAFVALAGASGEVLIYDVGNQPVGAVLIPALSLPTGTQPLSVVATRRGIVFADGPAGAVHHVLR